MSFKKLYIWWNWYFGFLVAEEGIANPHIQIEYASS